MEAVMEEGYHAERNMKARIRNHFYPLAASVLKNQEIVQSKVESSFVSTRRVVDESTEVTKKLLQFSNLLDSTLPSMHDSVASVIASTEKALKRAEALRLLLPVRSYKNSELESFGTFYRDQHPMDHDSLLIENGLLSRSACTHSQPCVISSSPLHNILK